MKRIITGLLSILCSFCIVNEVWAKEKITVYVFTKDSEAICDDTMDYLKSLQEDYSFKIKEYVIWSSEWKEDAYNRKLADNIAKKFNETILGAPYIVIGDKYTFDEYTDELQDDIQRAIANEIENDKYVDLVNKTIKEMEKQKKIDKVITISLIIVIPTLIGTFIYLSRKSNKKN